MRVAMLSPVAWRTPPEKYGPWELVTSNITEALVEAGIDVTLFATGDSITKGKLEYCIDKGYAENPLADAKVSECLHISNLFEKAASFDIIHNNYDFLPLTYSALVSTPVITTIHGFSSPLIVPVYKKYNHYNHYVSISESNRHPDLNYLATVYNGINTNDFSFNPKDGDYLLFFGRIHPEKGTLEAIQLAKSCRRKLVIAGLIQDADYYNQYIQPHIDNNNIIYAGNCAPAERDELLGGASALLHLISFDEPFGLSVVEAMCCGTPVIAFNRGAMPEIIQHNKTGFIVNSLEEAKACVNRIHSIDRSYCHEWVMNNFSREKMAMSYLDLYKKILST
jgi:glycosyltransferase involved in cell wall biosynthesis